MAIRQETKTNFIAGAIAVDDVVVYFIGDNQNRIIHLTFARDRHHGARKELEFCLPGIVFTEDKEISARMQEAVGKYMTGKSRRLTMPTGPFFTERGTAFQQKVWRRISGIGYGSTKSYGEIARSLGNFRLARAVGQACHANPLALLVPCHRVVGVNSLGGFAGGVGIKSRLLALERRFSGVGRLDF